MQDVALKKEKRKGDGETNYIRNELEEVESVKVYNRTLGVIPWVPEVIFSRD